MRSVIVGYGNAAALHEKCYPNNVRIVGVVDINRTKRTKASEMGYPVFPSVREAVRVVEPDFWDLCTPPETHFPITEYLLKNLSGPNILVEKPCCMPGETQQMRALVRRHSKANVSVNENYLSSEVVRRTAELVAGNGIEVSAVSLESTKNRIPDILQGRYLDEDLLVFGYEGPHMATLLAALLWDMRPLGGTMKARVGDLVLPLGSTRDGESVLKGQGRGEINYVSRQGARVSLYTSMDGRVKFPFQVINAPASIPVGAGTKYRAVCAEGDSGRVVSRLAPTNDGRNFGRVVFTDNSGRKIIDEEIPDSSMNSHLAAVVGFFEKGGANPSPVNKAADIVDMLAEAIALVPK